MREQIAWIEDTLALKKAEVAQCRLHSGLGKRFETRTFETFTGQDFQEQKKTAEKYADTLIADSEYCGNLLVMGSYGTGKTHLAAAVANKVMDELIEPVMFATVTNLFDQLRDFDRAPMVKAKAKTCVLLILDDVGKEKATEWNRSELYEIINARYEDELPTIITTNFTAKELNQMLGEATFSRIYEDVVPIEMDGANRRMKR